ncbi:MAG TPA: glycosyltransferase [Longimicrobium sp.]|jgi:glycosyltransferase involved in cell wall biosynthesis|nr:glycosyltransferase [Longimicrobium sp.]
MYVIAHNGSPIFGGGELGTVLLLAGLQGRGHRVLMLCLEREIAARVESYGVPAGVQRVGGEAVLTDALRLGARLRRERPDAVILTTFRKVLLSGLGARLGGVRPVVQRIVLEGDTPARGARYRWALRRLVDVVTLNAEAMRAPFLAGGLDPRRVVTLHDGVRTPERTREPGAVRRELGIPPGAPVVGAVARLAWQKRLDRLVRALALLPSCVHCVVTGEGEERAALQSLAAGLGVADRLHLPGFRRDVGDVLDAIDLFVVSSDREGMANAMLEAMAFGVPVVSTPVSGAAQALEPFDHGGAPGEIVEFSVDGLAAALRRLLADAPARRAMGEAGRRRVAERFSYETMLDRWEALLAGRPPAPAATTA